MFFLITIILISITRRKIIEKRLQPRQRLGFKGYFCSMKHLTLAVALLFLPLFTAMGRPAAGGKAEAYGQLAGSVADSLERKYASAEVGLLTCGPGDQLYTLYGHTAIHYRDSAAGEDVVLNYGIFSFSQEHLALKFMMGKIDYSVQLLPFRHFVEEYRAEGRWVAEQKLDLTGVEKARVREGFAIACRPENRTYRYNIFYNNCSTKARDLLDSCFSSPRIERNGGAIAQTTFRAMVAQNCVNHPWAMFGNDLLLGLYADTLVSTVPNSQFLPDSLRKSFGNSYLDTGQPGSGIVRPLVKSTEWIVPPLEKAGKVGFPTPFTAMVLFGLVAAAVCAAEWKTRKAFRSFDAVCYWISGLAGLLIAAMAFSEHPTVNLNLQILLLNPAALIPAFNLTFRQKRYKREFTHATVSGIFATLFLVGGFFQHYAEGMATLALILLLRIVWRTARKTQSNR